MTLPTKDQIGFLEESFKYLCKCITWIKSWKIWGKINYFIKMYKENLQIYKYTGNKYESLLTSGKGIFNQTKSFKTWIYIEDGCRIIVFEIDGKKYTSKFSRWRFLSPFCIYKKNTGIRICLLKYVKMCRYYRNPISNFPHKDEIINEMLVEFINTSFIYP